MKVAIVNRHLSDVLGGSESQCHNIANGLAKRGHDVVYVAPAGRQGARYGENYTVVPVDSTAAAIAGAVVEIRPDIVYWRFNKYFFLDVAKAIHRAGIPLVFAVSHINDIRRFGYYENPSAGPMQLLRSAKQILTSWRNHGGFRYVSGLTSLNPDYLGRLSIARQRFIPNSVSLESRPFTWPRPFVLWVANIKPTKQPERYLMLAKELAGAGVDFLMVGDIQSDDYRYLGSEHERTPGFHYLGPRSIEEVNGMLSQARLLVHTCKPEGFGNNFIQAWFQAKPTVSFQFDPAGYIASHGLGGMADGNWNVFVRQVADLLADPRAAAAAGQRARSFADGMFSVDKTVDQLECFLHEILSPAGSAPAGKAVTFA